MTETKRKLPLHSIFAVAIVGTVCGVISAAIYAAAEQAVDAARMKAGGSNDRD